MQDFSNSFRFALRRMWTWWETYVAIILFIIIFSAIVSGSVKDTVVKQLESQIQTIKDQNQRSIEDRSYLHQELENTRSALRRLEVKVKSNKDDIDKP